MPHIPRVQGKIIARFMGLDYRNPRVIHPVAARLSLSHGLSACLLVLLTHAIIWLVIAWNSSRSMASILQQWDAGWYLNLVKNGYDLGSLAFLPLFPYLVRAISQVLDLQTTPNILWLGTGLSSLCFLLSFILLVPLTRNKRQAGLGTGAMLALLWSPASFIFHSFHTEGLFLLLSVLAFHYLHKKQWLIAAIMAGLAALVRHQGVFLAIAIAAGATFEAKDWQQKILRFIAMGCISGLLWALTPWLHYSEGRGLFPALSAHQSHWFIADSLATYFKTLVFANPMQNLRFGSILHHIFYTMLCLGLGRVIQKGRWAEGIYCLLSLAIMPLQGELVDAFRFGAILFPVLFALGELWATLPRRLAWPILIGYLALNLAVTWSYGIGRWAY